MQVIYYTSFILVTALFQGRACSSSATGSWYKCHDKYYYLSVKPHSWLDSFKFCAHSFSNTVVADFGKTPEQFAKNCSFNLVDRRQYWMECWNGQPQLDCTILTKHKHKIDTIHTSCSTLAYPICESSNTPPTFITAPSVSKPTSPLTSKKISTTAATKGTPVPSTSVTSPVSTVSSTPPLSFPVLCAMIQGTNKRWLIIAHGSYCVTKAVYSYDGARKACQSLNSSLADIRSTTVYLNPILVGLGLSKRINLKLWINGTRQGKNRILRINGTANLALAFDALSSKYQAFCERVKIQPTPSAQITSLSTTTSKSKKQSPLSMQNLFTTSSKASHKAPPPIVSAVSTSYLSISVSPSQKWPPPIASTVSSSSHNVATSPSKKWSPSKTSAVSSSSHNVPVSATPSQKSPPPTSSAVLSSFLSVSTSPSQKWPQSTASAVSSSSLSISAAPSQKWLTTVSSSFLSVSASPSQKWPPPTASAVSSSFRNISTSLSKKWPPPTAFAVSSLSHNVTSPSQSGGYWAPIDTHDYYVIHNEYNYTSALEHCKRTLNASLMTCASPIRYFEVLSQLHLINGSYWIGANTNGYYKQGDGCLSYHRNTNSLSSTNCIRKMSSICSRSAYRTNITELLENAAFRKMLKEMTVNEGDTTVNKRKRVSMNNDHRRSVQAAGGVSVVLLCLLIILPILIDLSKLGRCSKIFGK